MTVTLLGEVTARVGGRQVELGPARQRCVLAALAVDAGRLVPPDLLVARVWGADTPRRGRATLYSHLSRLRHVLGAGAIAHRTGGYTLVLEEQAVDLLWFRALCGRARETADDEHKAGLLAEALALWLGEPLNGLSGEWVESERTQWRQERRAAEHDLVDARLRLGQGEELVTLLAARAERYPLDERVAGQHMLALHRAGRSADALEHYRALREHLVTELGTDPGAALADLHRQILAADPGLLPAPRSTVPRQLPSAPASFVGRREELARLDAGGGTISAIGGAGGIGKTWLALTWAHHNLHLVPDGQLFVDLRGFDPTGTPAHPADVLGGFLDALGVGRDRQPKDQDHRAELYRRLVAGKRMLVVLDNAATTEQVTPLLPGGRHCTVLVTSRNQLHGLIARHGAQPTNLDMLTDTEAHALLATALGPARAAEDRQAVAELIRWCGGFPLALGVIAARAATDPHLPLRDIADELRVLGLDALESQDPTASLPTVLSWSLCHLTDRQREVFSLLGIAPGPDIGLPAASCLTGLPEREAHKVLRTLADASLINRAPGGRYGMHDLVRAYATTTADDLPDGTREAALRRVLACYTHTAYTTVRLLDPHRPFASLAPPAAPPSTHPPPDAAAAWAWLDTEHQNLLAALHTATTLAWHVTVWQLAWGLQTLLSWRGHLHDQLAVWQAAADAATHLPDPRLRVLAVRYLGLAHTELGRHDEALRHLNQAITIADDPAYRAHAHLALAHAWERKGDDQQALAHAWHTLHLHRDIDDPVGEARALNSVGWYTARVGRDYDSAREHCQAALAMHRDHRHRNGEAATLDSLGYIDHHSGRHAEALDHYRQALAIYEDVGNAFHAAYTLDQLGHPHVALGQLDQARAVWREAVRLYAEHHRHDDAARVRRQLDDLG